MMKSMRESLAAYKLKNVQPETCSHKAEFGSKKASKNKRTDSACLIPYPAHHPSPYMQNGVFVAFQHEMQNNRNAV
jgi:hypothetical protein